MVVVATGGVYKVRSRSRFPRCQHFRPTLALVLGCVVLVGSSTLMSSRPALGSERPHDSSPAYGIDAYFAYSCQTPQEVGQDAATQVADDKALGATYIGISFPLYTATIKSNDVFAKDSCTGRTFQSPPAAIVGDVVAVAHAAGMKVLLRPIIDSENLYREAAYGRDWRGTLEPKNVKLWFANYLATLRPYLLVAQSEHVEEFALETELDSLADLSEWATTIKLAKEVYKGDLVFDYSWKTGVKKRSRKGTSFAVDAYPQIKGVGVSASPRLLLKHWNAILPTMQYHIPNLKLTTIDEIGIAAQDGAYSVPAEGSLLPLASHPFNQSIQENWFTAACEFMKQHDMLGIFYWSPESFTTDHGAMPNVPDPTHPAYMQPKAQSAVKTCFT